jgi:hypothetical protein
MLTSGPNDFKTWISQRVLNVTLKASVAFKLLAV